MDEGNLRIVRVDPDRGFGVEFSCPTVDWWCRYIREPAGLHRLKSLF